METAAAEPAEPEIALPKTIEHKIAVEKFSLTLPTEPVTINDETFTVEADREKLRALYCRARDVITDSTVMNHEIGKRGAELIVALEKGLPTPFEEMGQGGIQDHPLYNPKTGHVELRIPPFIASANADINQLQRRYEDILNVMLYRGLLEYAQFNSYHPRTLNAVEFLGRAAITVGGVVGAATETTEGIAPALGSGVLGSMAGLVGSFVVGGACVMVSGESGKLNRIRMNRAAKYAAKRAGRNYISKFGGREAIFRLVSTSEERQQAETADGGEAPQPKTIESVLGGTAVETVATPESQPAY